MHYTLTDLKVSSMKNNFPNTKRFYTKRRKLVFPAMTTMNHDSDQPKKIRLRR